jgi:hypothetical protein
MFIQHSKRLVLRKFQSWLVNLQETDAKVDDWIVGATGDGFSFVVKVGKSKNQ